MDVWENWRELYVTNNVFSPNNLVAQNIPKRVRFGTIRTDLVKYINQKDSVHHRNSCQNTENICKIKCGKMDEKNNRINGDCDVKCDIHQIGIVK